MLTEDLKSAESAAFGFGGCGWRAGRFNCLHAVPEVTLMSPARSLPFVTKVTPAGSLTVESIPLHKGIGYLTGLSHCPVLLSGLKEPDAPGLTLPHLGRVSCIPPLALETHWVTL
jgi:hypothetical protein